MAKTILIFGAGPGISQGIARRFGAEGFVVTLVARKEDHLHQQVAALTEAGIDAHAMYGDVADPNGVRRVIDEHRKERGIPDVVVYNASAAEVRDVLTLNWSTVRTLNEVNIGGALHVAQGILPEYLEQDRGKLFFTGGGQALSPHPEWTALSIGKAGMRNLVQSLVKRVEGSRVHVATVTVCGYVQPSDPRYNPVSIADLYWRLYEQAPGEFEAEVTY
ncbi:MAG: SDR family NAD(P)-dependent oxidoreductase [Saprospiraceae bacterium]|nr:SDR family NAD(P)-dependent oxidoreductase [Saprospiraceae bacterium]MCB9312704.1 SDR family NAD(P)-dependent oxidoreductase [Lewinellaceae bacterium]